MAGGPIKDISGRRFGRLFVVNATDKRKGSPAIWECKCDCGKTVFVAGRNLISGHKKSCGCLFPKPPKDRTGQRFGKLVALMEDGRHKCGDVMWRCKCDCGQLVLVSTQNLRKGFTKSCGCLLRHKIDKKGKRFGRLVVFADTGRRNNYGDILWECKCDCGGLHITTSRALRAGNVNSCGCIVGGLKRSTGLSDGAYNRLTSIWRGIKRRCDNPKDIGFRNYGARGIKVCEGWYNLSDFLRWAMANGYKDGLCLFRIEKTGDYSPDNCQFRYRSEMWLPSHNEQKRKIKQELRNIFFRPIGTGEDVLDRLNGAIGSGFETNRLHH